MYRALELARKAEDLGEVPVGAVVVKEGKILAEAFNLRESQKKSTAHAELLALEAACEVLDAWRLVGCTLYVTLEPCLMCSGALVQSRLERVVFGAFDPKAGAVSSLYKCLQDPRLNHQVEVTGGVLADECACLLSAFFKKRRRENKTPSF